MPSKTIDIESLKKKAKAFRRDILETLEAAGSGHSGGSLSAVEIFLTLYGYQINHKPNDPSWEDRDRVIVSKGHVSPVVYVIHMVSVRQPHVLEYAGACRGP